VLRRERSGGHAWCCRCGLRARLASAHIAFLPPHDLVRRPPSRPHAGLAHTPQRSTPSCTMKALLSRFNRGLTGKKDVGADRDKADGGKHRSINLPPLPEWPPQGPQRAHASPTRTSQKPLPELGPVATPPPASPARTPQEPSRDLPRERSQATVTTATHVDDDPIPTPVPAVQIIPNTPTAAERPSTPTASPPAPAPPPDSTGRSSGRTASGKAGTVREEKKVAFRSPPPSPGPDSAFSQSMSREAEVGPGASTVSLTGPLKTPASRFQSQHGHGHSSDAARGSTSTQASSSRTQVGVGTNSKATGSAVRLATTRSATSPYPKNDAASMHQSMRSNTPYSQAESAYPSEILAVTSWSEAAESDLVSNLGPRERTRQEVLWEIVASEERFVFLYLLPRPSG
jgi:hypothetical protein